MLGPPQDLGCALPLLSMVS